MTETITYDYVPPDRPPADLDLGEMSHVDDPVRGEPMRLNMGPQHPATHGVLRLIIEMDGETMVSLEPVVGYLHRSKEKSCESLGWYKWFPHTDRLDYVQPILNNIGYALALEKLAGLAVPERAQIARVLLMELSRIAAHIIWVGTMSIDLGAVTIFFHTFGQREKIYDILDGLTGHRMHHNVVRVGGLLTDIGPKLQGQTREFLEGFAKSLQDVEKLLTRNRIWHDRNVGVGVIPREAAIAWSLTGPNLRASGVDWDLRKREPYSGYETYDFEVPTGTTGDSYDRYLVRMEEMRQSLAICHQALDRLATTPGDVLAEDRRYVLPPRADVHASMEELITLFKIITDLRLPAGEAYMAVEASKGELGYYVASDGSARPLRCHVRSPSLMNVQAVPLAAEGRLLSDIVAVIGSLDFVMGEVDR